MLAELDDSLKPEATYLHGPLVDQPLRMLREGTEYFYHADTIGSVAALTSSSGEVAASYDYDAFGNPASLATEAANPFLFAGRPYQRELKLYDNRMRFYDPSLGRFTSKDIVNEDVFNALSINRYAYVQNAPTRYVDPLGLDPIDPNDPVTKKLIEVLKEKSKEQLSKIEVRDGGLTEFQHEARARARAQEMVNQGKDLSEELKKQEGLLADMRKQRAPASKTRDQTYDAWSS